MTGGWIRDWYTKLQSGFLYTKVAEQRTNYPKQSVTEISRDNSEAEQSFGNKAKLASWVSGWRNQMCVCGGGRGERIRFVPLTKNSVWCLRDFSYPPSTHPSILPFLDLWASRFSRAGSRSIEIPQIGLFKRFPPTLLSFADLSGLKFSNSVSLDRSHWLL